MKMRIYDYDDKIKEVEIPDDKHIKAIHVTIWSGDETGFMVFTEGGYVDFDASDNRYASYYDGQYIVDGDNIQKWLNWIPAHGEYMLPYSYMRQMAFSGL
jgi:hypothetical protein